MDTQIASNFPSPWIMLQSALYTRKCIWDLYPGVDLLGYKVCLCLISSNVPDSFPELLQQPTLPAAWTRAPKSPYLCQHLASSSFLDFLAEHSGFCYQHSCWNNVLPLLSMPCPSLAPLSIHLYITHLSFPSDHEHFLSALLDCLFFSPQVSRHLDFISWGQKSHFLVGKMVA